MDKPGTERWSSVADALKTFYSFSRVTKGSGPISDDSSISNQSASSSRIGNSPESCQDEVLSQNGTSDEEIDETPMFGGGRGILLQNLQKQFARQKLDETIHNELKEVFGNTDFSNEAIENHFASVCSYPSYKPSTQETGEFSDVEDYEQGVAIVVGESNIMKKINAHEKSSALRKKKKSPRCRNAIVLSLTQKKTLNENEQDAKKAPELKGPDLFLPNKSYSRVVSAANSSSFNQADGTMFNDEDFPAL